eukprot:GFYU01002353.1.p1 GENE.GFYU01002353.1~~GFYU01002353.1.p1  ORF type:complete len:528 (-),score=151.20 GFYU01002353.1:276-1859(-)
MNVKRQAQKIYSSQLKDRHPYLDPPFSSKEKYDPLDVTVAFGHMTVPKFGDLMDHGTELEVQERICCIQTCTEFLSDQELKEQAIDVGIVTSVLPYLGDENPTVRESSALLLSSLAKLDTGKTKVAEASAVVVLQKMLFDTSKNVKKAAAEALKSMSETSYGADILVAECVISDIVITLDDMYRLPDVAFPLLITMENLTRYDDGVIQALHCGFSRRCIMAFRLDQLRVAALMGLWNLANHPDGKADCIYLDVTPVLANYLKHESAEVRRCATGALMAISINEDGKRAVMNHCIDQLAHLLYDGNKGTRHNAASAIRNSSELPNSMLSFTRVLCGKADKLNMLYGGKVVDPLSTLMTDSDANVRYLALRSMEMITRTEAGQNRAVNGRAVLRLSDALNDDENSDNYKELVIKTIRNICAKPEGCERFHRYMSRAIPWEYCLRNHVDLREQIFPPGIPFWLNDDDRAALKPTEREPDPVGEIEETADMTESVSEMDDEDAEAEDGGEGEGGELEDKADGAAGEGEVQK